MQKRLLALAPMGARARFGGIAAPGGTGMEASGNCYISLNSQYQLDQSLEADIPAFYKEWLAPCTTIATTRC